MNDIDLTKILEGCPKGTEFYHKMYGTVKFNPKTFQPFDKMLARNSLDCYWAPRFFGYMDNLTPRDTNGSLYVFAIPYSEDTKHLLGTSDDCPEYYKWWEK